MRHRTFTTPVFLLLWLLAGSARAQVGPGICGSLENAFGPFDYRTNKGNDLHLVESAHFTPPVESLIKGVTGKIGGDIDYTLRAFPNHHRALLSVMRYGEKTKSAQPSDLPRPVECYLERAVRFRPDDAIARMIFSMYLAKAKRLDEALFQLDTAAAGAEGKENPFTHYNLGLNYLELKAFDKALAQAHKAYGMGFPQPELRDRLKEVGKWTDPSTDAAATPASAPSAQ